MTVSITVILALLLLVWTLYCAICLVQNYISASKVGVPVVACLVTPDNQLWIAVQTAFSKILYYFPFDATTFTRHCRLGWEFHDRYRTHQRLGDAWILATPNRNWLFVSNPEAITDIFNRGRDFTRPVWMLEALNVFGPSIATSEGKDWQRHRKLTATPFNESKSVLVWDETLRQAKDMLKTWVAAGSEGFKTTSDDTRTLALHVLAFVAFQKSYPFGSVQHKTESDIRRSMTYRDSLALILQNALLVLAFPRSFFTLPFMPVSMQQVGWAITYFHQYMLDQIKEERQLVQDGKPGSGTLISNLVRASSEATNDNKTSSDNTTVAPLSEAELLGNIFVYNFAGHDTTAISLSYGMFLLISNREVQDWIHEEIQHYAKGNNIESLEYNDLFPKLKRCQAVLLETLRLYNPLPGVPKYTGERHTEITVNGTTFTIPSNTLVVPHLQSQHTHPRHWGSDSLVWRPQRWIEQQHPTGNSFINIETEQFTHHEKGEFFAWSEGIRNCPGKKFAQVEFVAVLASLFQSHVAEPVPLAGGGESMEKASERLLNVVKDSTVELLLQMREPRKVAVRWMRR